MASNYAACPLESANRAQQCRACCYQSAPVPPCVASYLRSEGSAEGADDRVVPIWRAQEIQARRAA